MYFTKSETMCKCGCGMDITPSLLNLLEKAREIAKTPFTITSGARCETHNKRVGGTKNSAHLRGLAVDIKYNNSEQKFKILESLFLAGFKRIGDNTNLSFIHCDIDKTLPQNVFFKY